MADISGVLPASFRGVPFAVRTNATAGGRRQAVHEYPGKDGVFPEDMGRRGRRYHFQGFIVSNSAVYGGGPVQVQRELLIAALEQKGPGLLIHPTLGVLTVSVDSYSVGDPIEAATTADLDLSFIEYTQPSVLGVAVSTITQVLSAALVVDAAASAAFTASGVFGVSSVTTSAAWTAATLAGGQDATALTNLAAQLPGPYGRYYAGGNAGYLASSSGSVYAGDTTVEDLASAAAVARSGLSQAAATVAGDFAALSTASAPQAAADVQTLVGFLLAACADPADALRILENLAGLLPNTPAAAVSDLYRRAAVTAAARASTNYQPSSCDDAQSVQAMLTGLLDNEITIAGDEGDDADYDAFRSLRVAVVQDLQTRGGALAPLKTFAFAEPLPALRIAQQLYGDASRSDQLVTEADPIHPLFMPTGFSALAN